MKAQGIRSLSLLLSRLLALTRALTAIAASQFTSSSDHPISMMSIRANRCGFDWVM